MKQIKRNNNAINADLPHKFLFTISHNKNNNAIHVKDHTVEK